MTTNEDAGVVPGARKNYHSASESKPQQQGKYNQNQGYEDRRNAAACFANRHKREDWQADFVGVMVVEGLPTDGKVWVNIKERTSRNGQRYLSVVLQEAKS